MAESIPEQITLAVIAKLKAIVGGSNPPWSTPSVVVRVPGWAGWENDWLDQKYQTMYFVKAGMVLAREEATGVMHGDLELWLLLATQYKPDALNPVVLDGEAGPLGETLQNRLEQDLRLAIQAGDVQLGGLSENVLITDVNKMTIYVEGWALIEARLKIPFSYLRTTA